MTREEYLNIRRRFKTDIVSVMFSIYRGNKGDLPANTFAVYISIVNNYNPLYIPEVLKTYDIKYNLITIEDLVTNTIIDYL